MSDANTAPFTIHETGDVSGETWTGEFMAKKWLSHRDHLRKDQVRRELLGGQAGAPTERALTTAMILSELAVRLVKAPSWWADTGNGLDLLDDNVIGIVYDAACKVETDAVEAKKSKAEAVQTKLREEAAKAATQE